MWPSRWTGGRNSDGWGETARVTALKRYILKKCATWGSNTEAVHYAMLERANAPALGRDKDISSRYMRCGGVGHKMRLLIKKLQYGVFQTQARDHMMRPGTFTGPECVVCKSGARDGCGHVMGECTHPEVRACHLKRHNEAVRQIARAIASGSNGRWLVVADLKSEELGTLAGDVGGPVRSRPPPGLLPGLNDGQRRQLMRMRPDILLMVGAEDDGTVRPPSPEAGGRPRKRRCTGVAGRSGRRAGRVAYIVEVGYTRDCNAAERRKQKAVQHERLAELLRSQGWVVRHVPVVLGHCGSVYKEDIRAMQQLGVDKKEATRLFESLHDNAIRLTCAAARAHQRLRAEANRTAGRRWRTKREPP
jgi:hypothetical protein